MTGPSAAGTFTDANERQLVHQSLEYGHRSVSLAVTNQKAMEAEIHPV